MNDKKGYTITIALVLVILLLPILLYFWWMALLGHEEKRAEDAAKTLEENYYNQDRVEINLGKIEIDNCTDIIESGNKFSVECNARLYGDSNEINPPLVPVQMIDNELFYEGVQLNIGDSIEYRPAYQDYIINATTTTRANYPAAIEAINGVEIK